MVTGSFTRVTELSSTVSDIDVSDAVVCWTWDEPLGTTSPPFTEKVFN